MGEVFVVDNQGTVTPVPPMQQVRGTYVLYILLGLALFGVLVEGVFIYRLYQKTSTPQQCVESVQQSRQMGENKTWDDGHLNRLSSTQRPPPLPPAFPPRPRNNKKTAVFLHLQHSSTSAVGVIQWSDFGFPAFNHGFKYSNGSLIIHTEGFYFMFSKVSFTCSTFQHQVKLNSERYSYKPISLMVDNRHSLLNQIKPHQKIQFSSYLGGVWLLHKKEEVFVSVDTSCLAEGQEENFFGGFMI